MKHLKLIGTFLALFVTAFLISKNVPAAAFLGGALTYATQFVELPQNILGVYVGVVGPDGQPAVQVISSERDRATFINNQSKFPERTVVQGYLRLEAVITGPKAVLTFKTFDGDGASVYPTERRLDKNDSFVIDKIALKLLKQDIANGKTNGELFSYPNVFTFGQTAADDLRSIYTAGELSITIDRVQQLIAYDTHRFLHVPQVQKTAITNYDQQHENAGFAMLTPNITIHGSGTNDINLKFATFTGWAGASAVAGTEHRAVLILRGLHITGK